MRRRSAAAVFLLSAALSLWASIADAQDYGLPEPVAGGEVEVVARPHVIVLGEASAGEVECSLPRGATMVQMFAAHGSLRDIDTSTPGKATAIYEPPEEFLPRIDVVAVRVDTDDGPLWGYAAFQLVGQGEAMIRTGPFAEATIEIGKVGYGPAKADRRGRAEIQVKVPPGTGVGLDGEGREVDLHVPKLQRCAIFAGAEEVRTESEEGLDFLAVPFGSDGARTPDDRVVVSTSRGEVTEIRRLDCGALVGRFVPSRKKPGIALLEAKVEGSDAPVATVEVVVVPGLPAPETSGKKKPDGVGGGGLVPSPEVPWFSASLGGGFAWNMGALRTFDVAADMHVKLPLGGHRFFAGIEVNFSRAAEERTTDIASTETDISSVLWTVPLSATAGYRFVAGQRWAFPLSVNLGAVLVDSEIEMRPRGAQTRTEHEIGYLFGVGGSFAAEFTLGPGAIFFEVRYTGLIGSMDTVDGNLSNLYLDLGYRLFFGD